MTDDQSGLTELSALVDELEERLDMTDSETVAQAGRNVADLRD